MGEIIIFAVIILVLVLWPVKKAAEWFGAENATYIHVFIALIVQFVLVIGAILFVFATGLYAGWVLIVVAIGASFAKVLGTTFLRGLGITIVGSLLSVAVGYVLSLILGGILNIGSLFSPEGEQFEGDVTIIEKKVEKEKKQSITDVEEEKVKQQVKKPEIKTEPIKFEWHKADISELSQFINKPIEIETTRGTIRKGYLLGLANEIATVGNPRSTQGISFVIPYIEIKSIKVYDKVLR